MAASVICVVNLSPKIYRANPYPLCSRHRKSTALPCKLILASTQKGQLPSLELHNLARKQLKVCYLILQHRNHRHMPGALNASVGFDR